MGECYLESPNVYVYEKWFNLFVLISVFSLDINISVSVIISIKIELNVFV